MNWNDIDFSAIQNMVNSLSDEQKENIRTMAQDMMKGHDTPVQEEEEAPVFDQLGIEEEQFTALPGKMQDDLEAALDAEQYYEDDPDADFSAAALFYSKALLEACRQRLFPVFKNVLDAKDLAAPGYTTLSQYLLALDDENIRKLADEGFADTSYWVSVRDLLRFAMLFLQRAEYDTISYSDLLAIKSRLIEEKEIFLLFEAI